METLKPTTETKAIKEHQCNFCGEKIFKGEIYHKSTHKFDGDVYDWKAHTYCSELVDKLNMFEYADEGVTQDIFMETISAKHDDTLIALLPNDPKFSDVIEQLRRVRWRNKLWYVIRYYKRLEKKSKQ